MIGHGGTSTSELTALSLPKRLRAALERRGVLEAEEISTLLKSEIERFDNDIGEAVKVLCRANPSWKENEGAAAKLVNDHKDTFYPAYHGTTLTIALLDQSDYRLWLAGVGDSTVGECIFQSIG